MLRYIKTILTSSLIFLGFILSIHEAIAAPCPEIVAQSPSKDYCTGSDVNLFVTATGEGLQFQWMVDGKIIAGANSNNYSIKSINFDNSGVYTCLVSGNVSCESVISEPIMIYAIAPAEITKQPKDAIVNFGDVAVFSFEPSFGGYGKNSKIDIQWYRGNEPLFDSDSSKVSGARSNMLTIKNVQREDAGYDYYAKINGVPCSPQLTTLHTRIIFITDSLQILNNPKDFEICSGGAGAYFEVNSSAVSDIFYSWFHNDIQITDDGKYSGTTTNKLIVNNPVRNDSGLYEVKLYLRNPEFQLTSKEAKLNVNTIPEIIQQTPEFIHSITDFTIPVKAVGSRSMSYQWYKDNIPVLGETSDTYIDKIATSGDNGEYYCIITNECGSTKSNVTIFTYSSRMLFSDSYSGSEISSLAGNEINYNNSQLVLKINTKSESIFSVLISDLLGNVITTYTNAEAKHETNSLTFDLSELNLTPGTYFVTIHTGSKSMTGKFNVTK